MFTGIVQHLGRVTETSRASGGLRLAVDAGPLAAETKTGDSVCVSGVCLTVTGEKGVRPLLPVGPEGASHKRGLTPFSPLRFDVIGETLGLSTLGDLRRGDPLNIELSLRPADRLGGHFVTGHVDGVATVRDRRDTPGEVRMGFACDGALTRQMIPKGSVAVDGVSLTLTEVGEGFFEVALIPHTLTVTTLGSRRSGDRVNLETDLLGKWVLKALGKSGGLTEDFLREHGFA